MNANQDDSTASLKILNLWRGLKDKTIERTLVLLPHCLMWVRPELHHKYRLEKKVVVGPDVHHVHQWEKKTYWDL